LSAPIIRSTFLSLSNSEDGADHVGMTNLTLWQESLKISPAVKDALAHANEKLMGGSVSQEKTTETFDVGEGRRQPDSIGGYYDSDDTPLLIVPPSNLEMRLVRTELLFHRGRRVDRHRTWLASVGGDSAIVRAGDVVVLEQQVDARRNGSYYVLDVTSSTWLLTTHWVLREENSNSDSNEKSDSVSVVNVDLRARRAQVIVNRGGHRVRWWRGSPCIIRLRSSSSASTSQTFLVGRIDSFDMVKNTLVVDIVSAQPTDRVSDEDAVVEDDMFGSGFVCSTTASSSGVFNTRFACMNSGGVWDRPCTEDEDCPFFRLGRGGGVLGGCQVPSGGTCEMPLGVQREGFRKYKGKPVDTPPLFAFEGLAPLNFS
jgi:hypothetical protein